MFISLIMFVCLIMLVHVIMLNFLSMLVSVDYVYHFKLGFSNALSCTGV